MLKFLPLFWLKVIIHLSAALPILYLYYGAFSDTIGADPVETVIHFTGIGAFNLLIITLLISPVAKQFKWPNLLKSRRLLGLYAATYALFHLLNFVAFELQFDIALLGSEIIKRPYITVGMAAFVIMALLSVTSLSYYKKRLGPSWQKLHNYTYIMACLVGVHFYWSVKSEIIEPSIYLAIVIALLSIRGKRIKQWLLPKKNNR
ncbi:protein-methionine-sulfoxide reductase heme-binding subunit MsrQ [Thalassotalea atypica]|uniref:protein-methionine-sulfoxide reductase heme-binding subunit MsrQ n=1 Tax=Thalassotalea atypica TaxID=2054316 RepID=UPI0025748975|nr:protein-methionine-sulfoxide reductase heme-binding subunit MsrQ [Thalassotalea atypica]